MVAHNDTEILKSTLTDKCAEDSLECDEMHRPTVDLYVHIDKGGAKKEAGQCSNEFVKLSGYFAKWSFKSINDSKPCCDDQCLPRKSHCPKSSFFVQKFNFDFPRKLSIFWGVKNS